MGNVPVWSLECCVGEGSKGFVFFGGDGVGPGEFNGIGALRVAAGCKGLAFIQVVEDEVAIVSL